VIVLSESSVEIALVDTLVHSSKFRVVYHHAKILFGSEFVATGKLVQASHHLKAEFIVVLTFHQLVSKVRGFDVVFLKQRTFNQ
jgi:hypothetical protein